MAAPKRKQPERKKTSARGKATGPGVIMRGFSALFGAMFRYPRLLSGMAIFAVIYSFIAANALWYQNGSHPSPFMVTRTSEPVQMAETDVGVTTFKIEREATAQAGKPVAAAKPSELVRNIQTALAGRGLYDGPADGVTGPKTTAAILFFEETEGHEPSGKASIALLGRLLKANSSAVAVAPAERYGDITSSVSKGDSVADLINQTETGKPAEESTLVIKIQKGLQKTYDGVTPDGIVGEQTRAAIRSFEKHYHLPVTGEPSMAVLEKLKSIGAI